MLNGPTPRRPPGHQDGDEDGNSLIEVMTVVAILGAVLWALFSALITAGSAETATEALVNNQQTVRLALDRMQADLTQANPVDVLSSTASYADEVQVEMGPNPGTRQVIRWYYDPAAKTIYRDVMSGNSSTATVVSQQSVITNVTNGSTGTQLFTYYDAANSDLQTANPNTPTNVANCAIRIHVDVAAASDPGPVPFHETIDIELRNRLPGGITGCPNTT
jgi:type II secretory pathway component PulJ